jgi:hypothetical protein
MHRVTRHSNEAQFKALRSFLFAITIVERVAGIEPASSAWKAEVLPLNHTRNPLSQRYAIPKPLGTANNGGGRRIRTFEGIAVRFTV